MVVRVALWWCGLSRELRRSSRARVYSSRTRASAVQRALMASKAQALPQTVARCKAFVHWPTDTAEAPSTCSRTARAEC